MLASSMLVLAFASTADAQSVVINEVLFNSSVVSDRYGEWVELYNAGSDDLDINGWTLADDHYDSHVIDNGGPLMIPAGGFLVMAGSADFELNGGVVADYAWGTDNYDGFALSNVGDEVALFDVDGVLQDWMYYVHYGAIHGYSVELLHPVMDNATPLSWARATTAYYTVESGNRSQYGTPGWENGVLWSEEDQVEVIVEGIDDLVDDGSINNGQANALQSKLDNILAQVDRGNTTAAQNQLDAFVNQVEALLASGAITQEQADVLFEQAELLQAMIDA